LAVFPHTTMAHPLFDLSAKITAIPVVHGSGDFAVEVRRIMLAEKFDCLAVPLPASFKAGVEEAIAALPVITNVVQMEARDFGGGFGEEEGADHFSPSMVERVETRGVSSDQSDGSRTRAAIA